METIAEVLRSPVAQALGWTLIHSLWQGLLCFLLGIAILRFMPSRQSTMRYATSVSALLLMFVCSVATFCMVYAPVVPEVAQAPTINSFAAYSQPVAQSASRLPAFLADASAMLSGQMGIVSALWLIGAFVFMLRLISGYWYINLIRRSADPVGIVWQQQVEALAARLNISTVIQVAQSNLINAPVVLGYLKPVILVPVGMFSGLTTEQLEAIFVHELMHIRRRDYLVNVVQSVLEALYFFNPFAWLLSANIRREREHCCDDGVVANHANTIAYVRALATLEEVRLSRSGVALSLAEDKNQLLQRIKRIMEKSVQRHSLRDRFVPAVLLVVGLMCASWLTIQSRERKATRDMNEDASPVVSVAALSDTTVKQKSGAYYHYSVTTVDKDGKEDTHVVEGFTDDKDMDSWTSMPHGVPVDPVDPVEPIEPIEPFIMAIDAYHASAIHVPPTPTILFPSGSYVAPVAPLAPMQMTIQMPTYLPFPGFDTIPSLNGGSWNEFGREFEETFKQRFEDFYRQHEEEMKDMMKDLEVRFGDDEALRRRADDERARAEEARDRSEEWSRQAEEITRHAEAVNRDNLVRMERAQRDLNLATLQAKIDQAQVIQMAEMEKEMLKLNESMKGFEQRLQKAQDQVQKEAVKDGYLKKDEKINSISINNDTMEINDKKIKPADAKRYREIMDSVEHHPGRHE